MGRQPKQGLDYYPRDVKLLSDPKFRRPRQEFGYLVYVVYDALLEILYGDKGYYIPYRDEDEKGNVIWVILSVLAGHYTVTAETVSNVIDSLTACGLFSDDLYQRGFITSKRAQETYYTVTVDRKTCFVDFDLWLLSENDMKELSSRSIILQKFIFRPINEVNRPINSINRSKNTQSKVKQSKAK